MNKKYIGVVTLIVVTSFFTMGAASAQTDSTLIKVQALALDSIHTPFPTYYSAGTEERAEELGALLMSASLALKETLGIETEFSVAVLSEADWLNVWPFPYGLPYVSLGEPWVVVLPANPTNSVLYPLFSNILAQEDVSPMIDNIGFHEVGHIYISTYLYASGGKTMPALRWFDEFLAQYLAYATLHRVSPERAQIWDTYTKRSLETSDPMYTKLTEFDEQYYQYLATPDGTMNYGWYQSVFASQAAAVYDEQGMEFLRQLKESLPWESALDWTTPEVLNALEALEPGFKAWRRSN